jgi:AmmeMemoRadiSam system protein B
MQKLEKELYPAKPDTILVISPHGPLFPDHFSFNLAPKFSAEFKQFGDFSTKLEFTGDVVTINEFHQALAENAPLNLVSEEKLDHGVSVPLYYLTQHLPDIKIMPTGYSMLSLLEHFEFGKKLKEEINQSSKRIAVVASGDLSHRLIEDAPAGFSPRGEEFDKKLIELISKKQIKEIVNLDEELVEEAGECGLRSIVTLLGILHETDFTPEILSYEGPFGVGYLVANLKI